MSPQSIAMSLSSSMPSQAMHQAQPPNLTLFGSAGNLQAGKVTTPLTHLGIAPHTLQSAMLHLSRQTQEQSGIVLPQNHFNNQGKSIAALFSFKKVQASTFPFLFVQWARARNMSRTYTCILMTTLGKQNVGILEVIASCFQALKSWKYLLHTSLIKCSCVFIRCKDTH